jgi:hypothetical protein
MESIGMKKAMAFTVAVSLMSSAFQRLRMRESWEVWQLNGRRY